MEKFTSEEVTSKTRSVAGTLFYSMQSFLCYLKLWEPVFFLINANPFHGTKRCANTERCCRELEISTERRVRRRKNMSGEN